MYVVVHVHITASSMYTHKMSSKLSNRFTCIFHYRFLPMFAVEMSHSGGIVNFFDFDPLPKLKNYTYLNS